MRKIINLISIGATIGIVALVLIIMSAQTVQGVKPENPPQVKIEKIKKFYLTVEYFPGDQATLACEEGYHMASMWEIRDVSNLKYDTDRGVTTADSGSGPPSGEPGYVRTGGASAAAAPPGYGNCYAWTSNDSLDIGTYARLPEFWIDPPFGNFTHVTSPWSVATTNCGGARVWCVSD